MLEHGSVKNPASGTEISRTLVDKFMQEWRRQHETPEAAKGIVSAAIVRCRVVLPQSVVSAAVVRYWKNLPRRNRGG